MIGQKAGKSCTCSNVFHVYIQFLLFRLWIFQFKFSKSVKFCCCIEALCMEVALHQAVQLHVRTIVWSVHSEWKRQRENRKIVQTPRFLPSSILGFFSARSLRRMRLCLCMQFIVHFPFGAIGTILDDNLLYYFSVALLDFVFVYCFHINFQTK